MPLGGYSGRVATVDLAVGSVSYEPIPEDWALKYIGARGLGVRYVYEAGPSVNALGPDNILCFMNGPLTGTEANMSGRLAIVTKSPLTGTVTDSHMGGWSAARLRWAGFDGLVFRGKATSPVYAYVSDNSVELRDATDIWGKGVHETVQIMCERYGEDDLSVMSIGQAGENKVRFAAWINETDRASGRGGTGCVGGDKMLKAVVVKSTNTRPRATNRDEWRVAHKVALEKIMDEEHITSPKKGGLSVFGTNVLMNVTNSIGALGGRNSQDTSFEEAEMLSGEYVKEHYLINDPTCHACPVACKKEVDITEGPYKVKMESVEYEPAWSLGANCGNSDVASVAYMINLANDWGYDAIEIGQALSAVMEATQREYIPTGEGIAWGDQGRMIEVSRMVTFREGIGDQLADGIEAFANFVGHPEMAMTVKGQATPAYDPRGLKGMGLGYATSNRGACHLRGYSPASELGLIGLKSDPLVWEGKGELLKLLQDIHAFSDSLDLCKFSAFAEGPDEYAEQYRVMTGLDSFTADDVLKTGERIYNLERHYNNLAGFGEGSDTLPQRFLDEPSNSRGSEGQVCELTEMLEEYYAARGWEKGVVTEAKLKELAIA
ncbi:MAG TPA: aldehyde ferredoxin oxidoreductase family protein [Dehalococcoidia bacterium]|nr:aldehyde ferredoxin oxidoreductase family protein [Dehalococcoidia bacterium]